MELKMHYFYFKPHITEDPKYFSGHISPGINWNKKYLE